MGTTNKSSSIAVWFSGFFGIAAILHALRVLFQLPVVIGTWQVPVRISLVIAIVFGLISLGLLKGGCCRSCEVK